MQKNNFKVFVSDEVFDFRTLEDSKRNRTSSSTGLARTRSYNAIDIKHKKDLPPLHTERQVVGDANVEKLPRPISNPLSYSQPKIKKPKQKNRSRTTDPRFRRSRSPTPKTINTSHSNNVLNKSLIIPSQGRNIRPFSASSPSIQMNNVREKTFKNVGYRRHSSVQSINPPEPCIMKKTERNFMEGNDIMQHSSSDIEEQFLCSLDYIDPVNLSARELNDDIEFHEQQTPQIPYWNDPRFISHNKYKTKVQPIKNNSIISLTPKRSQNSDFVMCRKSEEDGIEKHSTATYKYDDVTEICSCSLLSEEVDIGSNTYFKSVLEKPVVIPQLLGSIFGLIFFSAIIWMLHVYLSLDFVKTHQKYPAYAAHETEHYFVYSAKYVAACLIHVIDVAYDKIYKILLIRKEEIFNYFGDSSSSEETSWWS